MLVKENATIPFELLVTNLFGEVRTDITSVIVRVFHRVSGSEVDDLVATAMSGGNGKYYYNWVSTLTAGEYVIEYVITDTLTVVYKQYETLTVGYLQNELTLLQTDITLIKNIESGNWKIENNQMIFADANDTELFRCNLFDSTGKPSMIEVFRREIV